MPTIPLHLTPSDPSTTNTNPLPDLLHTPSGLALIELQGTLNLPPPSPSDPATSVGTFVFPHDPASGKVWLYIGQHQRMTGEMKKLTTPLGVMRRRTTAVVDKMEVEGGGGGGKWEGEEIEIAEVVRWKVVFAGRPEPVGGM